MSGSVRRFGLMTSIGLCSTFAVLIVQTLAAHTSYLGFSPSLTTSAVVQAAASADAATHKQWMNDASDAQENFRFALTDRDQKAAQEALVALESLMGKTEEYWTAKKAADGVKLAKESHGLATQAASRFKSGNVAGAQESFDKMGASCNACHELHLEKR